MTITMVKGSETVDWSWSAGKRHKLSATPAVQGRSTGYFPGAVQIGTRRTGAHKLAMLYNRRATSSCLHTHHSSAAVDWAWSADIKRGIKPVSAEQVHSTDAGCPDHMQGQMLARTCFKWPIIWHAAKLSGVEINRFVECLGSRLHQWL